jgi:hypothetical protein
MRRSRIGWNFLFEVRVCKELLPSGQQRPLFNCTKNTIQKIVPDASPKVNLSIDHLYLSLERKAIYSGLLQHGFCYESFHEMRYERALWSTDSHSLLLQLVLCSLAWGTVSALLCSRRQRSFGRHPATGRISERFCDTASVPCRRGGAGRSFLGRPSSFLHQPLPDVTADGSPLRLDTCRRVLETASAPPAFLLRFLQALFASFLPDRSSFLDIPAFSLSVGPTDAFRRGRLRTP